MARQQLHPAYRKDEGNVGFESPAQHARIYTSKVAHGTSPSQTEQGRKTFRNDWDMVLAPASEHGWRKELEKMTKIWVTRENPEPVL